MTAIFTTYGRVLYERAGSVRVGDRVAFGDDRIYRVSTTLLANGAVTFDAREPCSARLGPMATDTVLPIIRAKDPT